VFKTSEKRRVRSEFKKFRLQNLKWTLKHTFSHTIPLSLSLFLSFSLPLCLSTPLSFSLPLPSSLSYFVSLSSLSLSLSICISFTPTHTHKMTHTALLLKDDRVKICERYCHSLNTAKELRTGKLVISKLPIFSN
jgi:hypothetical protein